MRQADWPSGAHGPTGPDMPLFGRSAEREVLSRLLDRCAEGLSGALVLRGEPGTGKTALLDDTAAAAMARGMRTARLTGVESETQLGYAALHRLFLLFPGYSERLPGPQRDALRVAFGLAAGPSPDRFLVALAVLTLLAEAVSEEPLVCLVDDAQWLDPESALALGFTARRLQAERVVLLFAIRTGEGQSTAFADLPELPVGGLAEVPASAAGTPRQRRFTPGRLNSQSTKSRASAGCSRPPRPNSRQARLTGSWPCSTRHRQLPPPLCRLA